MRTYTIGSGTIVDDLKEVLTSEEYQRLEDEYGGTRLWIGAAKLMTPKTLIAQIIGYERALYLADKLELDERGVRVVVPRGRLSTIGRVRTGIEDCLEQGESVAVVARKFGVPERTVYRYKARLVDIGRVDTNPERQLRKAARQRTFYRIERVELPTVADAIGSVGEELPVAQPYTSESSAHLSSTDVVEDVLASHAGVSDRGATADAPAAARNSARQ